MPRKWSKGERLSPQEGPASLEAQLQAGILRQRSKEKDTRPDSREISFLQLTICTEKDPSGVWVLLGIVSVPAKG